MIRFNIIIRLLLVTKMKKAVILLILIFAFSFVVAENNDEPQLIVNIHPYCYGDDVNICQIIFVNNSFLSIQQLLSLKMLDYLLLKTILV